MKLLKPIMLLFICIMLMLSACGTSSTSLPSALRASNTDYPKSVSILAPSFFPSASAETKQQWLDKIAGRYGVTLNILSDQYTNSDADRSASSKMQDVLKGDTSYQGLFLISDNGTGKSDLSTGIATDSLVPLEDYLADNPIWNALPEDFKSLFEVDGHIYAIPTSFFRTLNIRVIHNEASEKIGIPVTDLNSFRDFALAYTKETEYPAIGSTAASDLTDILNAYGLYPGNSEYVPFAYDPKEDCYVDFMTKGAAVEAFEYLRELYKGGAISTKNYGIKSVDLIASNYRGYSDYDKYTEIFTLNPEYPKVAATYRRGFAMTNDTPQPQETVNFIVNMLFGSEQNYLECWLGSPDHYILNSDGSITFKLVKDTKGNYIHPGMPNLAGGLSDIFPYSDANIFYSQDGVIDMETTTSYGKYNSILKQQNDLFKSGAVVEIPLKYFVLHSKAYDARKTDIGLLYSEYFEKAITSSDQTVQQILDEYKAKMFNLGGNQMLDQMNAAIGKKTAYYYG